MRATARWSAMGLAGAAILAAGVGIGMRVAAAQTVKSVTITRIYTGADGLAHAEEIEAPFAPAVKLEAITGAEVHRNAPGASDWHPGPRRQYVITLTGQGELEVAGGKKVPLVPGHIDLIEDTTGKGHITRNFGSEDRITLWLPLAEQSGR
jgi:hypothetical protein